MVSTPAITAASHDNIFDLNICIKKRDVSILIEIVVCLQSLSQWVQCMVLSKNSARDRAEIMSKFINVAKVNDLLTAYHL
jgi:hypothetical protein